MVSALDAHELIVHGALLLDVREDDEFAAGRSPDALHIALASLPDRLGDLDASKSIVCVCRSGGRSARATEFLNEHGFTAVNLEGGMTAWHDAGLAMVADEGEPVVA